MPVPICLIRGNQMKPEQTTSEALQEYNKASSELVVAADSLIDYKSKLEDSMDPERSHKVLESLIERVDKMEAALEHKKKSETMYRATIEQLMCGGLAGGFARTIVAPIDRVKILLQTQHITQKGSTKYTGILQTWRTIVKEEGMTRLWRGNVANVTRVMPYAATQFTAYDNAKKYLFTPKDKQESGVEPPLQVWQRLTAGAIAGACATTLTHPLDMIRLRLAVEPHLKGSMDAIASLYAENGARTFMKGYVPTLMSLCPFIAVNFSAFDTLKTMYFKENASSSRSTSPLTTLGLGACAGIFAQTVCFPLDTIRRRMQLKGVVYDGVFDAFATIFRTEGVQGFYKGIMPNALKVIPNNAIRFMVFDTLKDYMKRKREEEDQ